MDRNNRIYDDIIYLPHPTSRKHPRMALENRAAQFLPFAALTGYGDAIQETVRLTDTKAELDEHVLARLNERLHVIRENIGLRAAVTITYFVPDDKKSGGAYVSHCGVVKKINEYEHAVIMEDRTAIPIEQISAIEGKLFGTLGVCE